MAFNKAKAERNWKLWKEAEEVKLRQLGMDEESIKKLRQMDWEDFKEERRYQEHLAESKGELEHQEAKETYPMVVLNIRQLFDSVEDERILHILLEADKTTLQILLLKMWGFSVKEIASFMDMPEKTVYTKVERLKKKIKKF
ncbi:MAG: sigma-70 family RNA polymerase sigma factor [Blautia sp.]